MSPSVLLAILTLSSYGSVLTHDRVASLCPDAAVHCACGNPPNQTWTLTEIRREAFKHLVRDCSPGALMDLVCRKSSCSPVAVIASPRKGKEYVALVPPPSGEIALQPEQTGRRRTRRFPKTCDHSLTPMPGTVIICWAWPKYLTCEFECNPGYALEENGKARLTATRTCRESDSYWKPFPTFPVCRPYIHCQVYLVAPGHVTCKSEKSGPPHCDIVCHTFEDQDEVPMKRYDCVDGTFADSLPRCASLNTTAPLVERPEG